MSEEQYEGAPGRGELTEYEKQLIESGGVGQYDNEWIKFVNKLSKNQSIREIAEYIEETQWTDRQKKTIMAYAKVVLGDGLSTTYFVNYTDYMMCYDDKALIDCDLPLGMTRFDITPEFNLLIGLINLHFGIETRKSKGGFIIKRIATQRHEIMHEESVRNRGDGFKERIKNKFGFGD